MAHVVNVVFGRLAADVLQIALARLERSEKVVVFPDDLSCGPLNPLGAVREIWMQNNLYLSPDDWEVFPDKLDGFCNTLKLQGNKIICWACPYSVYELCGFDQCIDQTVGNLYYIDTTVAAKFERGGNDDEGFPPRLAHISPEIAAHLIGTDLPVSKILQADHLNKWQQLRAENAPLRIIGPQGVQSVSLSHFDPLLLAFSDTQWQSARWVITQAAVEANSDNFFRVDMMILTGRLRALVRQGLLVADQDIMAPEVRVRLR